MVSKSVFDKTKLAKYPELALPAMKAEGGKFLARSVPIAVKLPYEYTRAVGIE